MDKSNTAPRKSRAIITLRVLICSAFFIALSIILGKFLKIAIGDMIRLSFENLSLLMAGICFGPVVGLVTATIADLLGCVLYGYAINPIVTLGAASIGFLSGFISHYVIKKKGPLRIIASVAIPHLVGSVIIKTFGLASWYLSSQNITLIELMLIRLGIYTVTAVIEGLLIYLLLKNKTLSALIERMVHK